MRIAAVLTCHNRLSKTLTCLKALLCTQVDSEFTAIDVYLVDDGSPDETGRRVKAEFPQVNVIIGNGTYYWNKGMYVAFENARRLEYDGYLWLNDDTNLLPTALRTISDTFAAAKRAYSNPVIIVGSVADPESGAPTYGGLICRNPSRRMKFSLVPPTGRITECQTMNGNCVFVPRDAERLLGNLDPNFLHSMGDIDYGLRAQQKGVKVLITPSTVAVCSKNSIINTYLDPNLSLFQRLKKIAQPKGLPPKSWLRLTRKHAGLAWPFYFIQPYIKALFGRSASRQNKNNNTTRI